MLDPDVDRQRRRHGAAGFGVGKRGFIEGAAIVEIFFDAGNPFRIEIDIAQHMRREPPHRIDAAYLGAESNSRNAKRMDRLALGGAHLAFEPYEGAIGQRQLLPERFRVETGHRGGQ